MKSVEPTESEELRGRVLGIIGAYGMGDSNPRALYLNTGPAAPAPETVHVREGGDIGDGVVRHALGAETAASAGAVSREERQSRAI